MGPIWFLAIWMGLGVAVGELARRDRPDDFDAFAAIVAMLFGPLFVLGLLGVGVVVVVGELAEFVAAHLARALWLAAKVAWSVRTRWRLWRREHLLYRELLARRFTSPTEMVRFIDGRAMELIAEAYEPEHAFLERWHARREAAHETKPIAGTNRSERGTP